MNVTDQQATERSLDTIKRDINAILEMGRDAPETELEALMRRIVALRYDILSLTKDLDLPDPHITWQIDRLNQVKAMLIDRLDVFKTAAVLRGIRDRTYP